jgi:GT2 family glycosyltransferase
MALPPDSASGAQKVGHPRASVIIPNWNGVHVLVPCLRALARQSFRDFEVIVVDNQSTDDSLQTLATDYPSVGVVPLDDNYGFARAINEGVAQARGNYLVFLNNDTEAEQEWLKELVALMDGRPDVGMADSKIMLFSEPTKLDSVGIEYSRWGFPTPRGRGCEESLFNEGAEVFACCGGASIIRRALVELIGAYDERFFAYLEDVDLSYRVRLAGYVCWNVPTSRIYHHLGKTSGGLTPLTRYHSFKNVWLVYLKNCPAPVLWRTFPRFAVLQVELFASALRRRQVLPILRAYWYLASNVRSIFRGRATAQQSMNTDWRRVYGAMDRQLPRHLNPFRLNEPT